MSFRRHDDVTVKWLQMKVPKVAFGAVKHVTTLRHCLISSQIKVQSKHTVNV